MTEEKASDDTLLKTSLEYIQYLSSLYVKNTEVISELISSLGESNKKLQEAIVKMKTSKSSKLWDRYFQELDSGNPRECVLNSLVELIKLEKQNDSINTKKLDKHEFLVRHCKNGNFEIYCDKKYLTKTDSLEKANELLMRHINDAKITNHVIYDYYEETCKQKFRR